MNTDCNKCIFNKDNQCEFNIPNLLDGNYIIYKKDNSNYIENYKCSYAFSTKTFEEHKENLPSNMLEYVKYINRLNYYMVWDCEQLTVNEIIHNYQSYISQLHTPPTKLSLICQTKSKEETKTLIDFLQKSVSIPWKLHNLLSNELDTDKLFDILNTNLINTVQNIWFIKNNDLNMINEDLNYINFLSKVLKPKYAAIRKNDTNLDGLFIAMDNLRLIKNEHEDQYVKFLQNNNTIVRKYYE